MLVDAFRALNPNTKVFTCHTDRYNVHSRIDRAYCSKSELYRVQSSKVVRSVGLSDHDLVIVSIKLSNTRKSPGIWKFNASMLKDTDFCNLIIQFWSEWQDQYDHFDSPLFWWDLGKSHIKNLAQEYGKVQSARKRTEKSQLLLYYNEALQALENGDDTQRPLVINLEEQIKMLNVQETKAYQVRTKVQYREEGERLTKYFINLEKQRGANTSLDNVLTDDGNLLKEPDEVLQAAASFYNDLYTAEPVDRRAQSIMLHNIDSFVPDNMQAMLNNDIVLQETVDALNSFQKNKSPGCDGLTVEFYVHFWYLLGPDFVNVINYAVRHGELSLSQRRGVITLLYKKGDRNLLKNWRPITLLNVDYKILTYNYKIKRCSTYYY